MTHDKEDEVAGKQSMIEDHPLQVADLPTYESTIEGNPKPTRSKTSKPAPDPNQISIFHKNRGRSERIFNRKMKNYKFDEHGTASTLEKAFDVYSLRNDSWKIVHSDVLFLVRQSVPIRVVFIMWGGYKSNDHMNMRSYFMSLDFGDEMFKEIELPLLDFPCSRLVDVLGSSNSLFAVYLKLYSGHFGVMEDGGK
ncbi:hypothetical protein Tco_0867133 [Tanacetum coccineum]